MTDPAEINMAEPNDIVIARSALPQVWMDLPGQMRVWLGDSNIARDVSWTPERLTAEAEALLAMAEVAAAARRAEAERRAAEIEETLSAAGKSLTDDEREALVQRFLGVPPTA